jgi:hypothetical protein
MHDGLIRRGAEHVKLHALHGCIITYTTSATRTYWENRAPPAA